MEICEVSNPRSQVHIVAVTYSYSFTNFAKLLAEFNPRVVTAWNNF